MAVEGAPGIGVLRERHLHASVKRWYAEPGDREEVRVDGYVIDLVRGDQLHRGADARVCGHEAEGQGPARARPPAARRPPDRGRSVDRAGWADGTFLTRRRSPRHGAVADIACELITFPELVAEPRFEVVVLLTSDEEYRHLVPGMCWRRRGWTVLERRLVDVLDRVVLAERQDLARLLPLALPATFTTADLAAQLDRPRSHATDPRPRPSIEHRPD